MYELVIEAIWKYRDKWSHLITGFVGTAGVSKAIGDSNQESEYRTVNFIRRNKYKILPSLAVLVFAGWEVIGQGHLPQWLSVSNFGKYDSPTDFGSGLAGNGLRIMQEKYRSQIRSAIAKYRSRDSKGLEDRTLPD